MHISSLPLLFECPSSQVPVEHPYNPGGEAADLGRAVHEGLAAVVMGRDPGLGAIAERYGVKVSDVNPLVGIGRSAWEEVRSMFPSPRVEERLEAPGLDGGGSIRGRADVFSMDGVLAVLDWKTSRIRSYVRPQLQGYGVAAVDRYGMPDSGEVKLVTVWLRLGEIDTMTMRADDIAAFYEELAHARRAIGKRYAPGEPCTFCPRQLVCRARHEYIRSAVVALQPVIREGMLPPELLPKLYPQAKALGKALDQYTDALRMLLRTSGPLEDGAGRILDMGEVRRTTIDPQKAWPILTAEDFSEDELAGCITMSSTAILEVAAGKADKGLKAKAKRELKERLRKAGAVMETVHDSIRVRKSPPKGT